MKNYDFEPLNMLQRIAIFLTLVLIELPFSWLISGILLAILSAIMVLINLVLNNVHIDSYIQGIIVFSLGIYCSNLLCYFIGIARFKAKIYVEISIKLIIYILFISNTASAFVIDSKALGQAWAKDLLPSYWIAFVAFVITIIIIKLIEYHNLNKDNNYKNKK